MSQYFDDDPIEVYLDRLLVALPGSGESQSPSPACWPASSG
jgi:hypothetical protein